MSIPTLTHYQQQHSAQLSRILGALPRTAEAALARFVRQFYAKVPVPELAQIDAAQAVAIAASAYAFIAQRESTAPKIRIFTPSAAEHGYDGHFTVIELLNDDMPFLVDSLSAELIGQGFTLRNTLHPILHVTRDAQGNLQELLEPGAGVGQAESLIHFEISALPEGMSEEQLARELFTVLRHIRASVEDWHLITARLEARLPELRQAQALFAAEAVQEVEDFLRWLLARNFIFLGYAEYDFFDEAGNEALAVVPSSRLGILKIDDATPSGLEALPPALRHLLLVPQLVEITKSNRRSLVHRAVPMDYIGFKRFDAQGKVVGEARFLGLFTSNVYYQSIEHMPLVRTKAASVLARSEFDPKSHDGKALNTIFEFLPRDELFQMGEDDLFETAMGILALEAKPAVRVFARRDAFERFVSAMIFVPRERFSTELRYQIQEVIEAAFNGTASTFATQISDAPLARLHLIVKTTPGAIPDVDMAYVDYEIAKRAYLFSDLLLDALHAHHGEQKAEKLQRAYGTAFPQGYINRYDAEAAVYDIGKIEEAIASQDMALELFQLKAEPERFVHLKIYNPNEEIALSDILPLLENAGFRAIEEHPFPIAPAGLGQPVWIRDFTLQAPAALQLDTIKPLLEEALLATWRRDMENDRFNALVLRAGLSWRQVVMLRAYARYMKQIGFATAQASIEQALVQHPDIARQLVALFDARFKLEMPEREAAQEQARAAIEAALAQVENASEDRILRRAMELIAVTLRTNYYQAAADGAPRPVLSFKLDSARVPELPLPRPHAEIFVYSPRVEGIHLRGGKVARGGLRWSDRPDDFRTEVLGLMKAQMVKNSVIVPVGSKGGFIVKRPTANREAWMQEGIACYTLYLQGLLDITDNIVQGTVTPPPQVVRHDEDDPYLVVAADKGTATFSDIANGVSAAYGFWLGDAFASGGSAGYDHKKMAITARGAWVSVARHFHEMGVDIDAQDFTVVGIGDMAGDVFGNGMILSEHIRLLAAFNHQHIFLDPKPDAKAAFAERQRLFNLPRSSWKDYDAGLISKGGGVFERSAKSIPLSTDMQTVLGIKKASLPPEELIRAILLAPVDLLWNGGIGTYVKAEEETHEQVGDRANNAVRVNGRELRCKVVGEGGNLGFTQKGRIEYARAGGRINTDAIDNSAGVDCSDHEVNIKIAFAHEMAAGKLTIAQRDAQLAAMTEEVAQLVLKDNILQTQAITIAEQQGEALLESQTRLIDTLERQGLLDRAIEFLPSDKALAELRAQHKGLTRPEIAVLLAYAKMVLYKEILASGLAEEAYFAADLMRYFPKAMQSRFAGAIESHTLRHEIIATVATNSLVNRAGITFFFDISADLGMPARDVVAAYTIARDAFNLRGIWKDIEAASSEMPVRAQVEMYSAITQFLARVTVWLLRNLKLPLDIAAIMHDLSPAVAEVRRYVERTQPAGPDALTRQIAGLDVLASAFDIISVARQAQLPVEKVAQLYFELGARLELGWLRTTAEHLATASHWERLAVQALAGDLYDEQRRLTAAIVSSGMAAWMERNASELARFDRVIAELKTSEPLDIPRLMVALRQLRAIGNVV